MCALRRSGDAVPLDPPFPKRVTISKSDAGSRVLQVASGAAAAVATGVLGVQGACLTSAPQVFSETVQNVFELKNCIGDGPLHGMRH